MVDKRSVKQYQNYELTKISKYVLSNIFAYLPLKSALRIRRTSHLFDEACYIGLRISCDHDLPLTVQHAERMYKENFTPEEIKKFEDGLED